MRYYKSSSFYIDFVFSTVQHSHKIALNLPVIFTSQRCFIRRHLEFLRVDVCCDTDLIVARKVARTYENLCLNSLHDVFSKWCHKQ